MSEIADELRAVLGRIAADAPHQSDGEFPAVWDAIVDVGALQIGLPEEHGGAGGDIGDLVVVASELARNGLGTPFVEAAISTWVLGAGDDAPFGTLCLSPRELDFDGDTVTGEVDVPWGADAGRLLVIGRDAVLSLQLDDASIQKTLSKDIAGFRTATLSFERTPAHPVPLGITQDDVRARTGVLRSASLLGAGRAAFDLTRSYVAGRQQFGAPLIEIPAVLSQLAVMSTHLKQAEVAVQRAVATWEAPSSAAAQRSASAVARIMTGAMATSIARQSHQLHGAMGVAQEYPLHRFTRMLWQWRDDDESELDAARYLGRRLLADDDDDEMLWKETESPT